ncbi:S1/P1 nuclease [Phenylobacterium sp.]|uniref:S1/P1 nuclease n=1 Tax=Phenylobacterium sp. TaxID=1871053 RepID=UPI00286C3CC0|nr:S1/P1 nuclease [Phenylobacterium sp.]
MHFTIPALTALAVLSATLAPSAALAWTRPGHMVSAAIAYDELAARDPEALKQILAIIAQHPDRGAFEVAAGRATGEDRDRRIFMQIARWPDDVRGGGHDHPTWHYAQGPVVDRANPPPRPPPQDRIGAALEAFALNARVAGDPAAPAADRAVALCWVFHLLGDIHQPLHTAQLFSRDFPAGDRGGGLQYVRDPQTGDAISLHWLWDDSVHRLGDPEPAFARSRVLQTRLPRAVFPELTKATLIEDFPAWGEESYRLAAPLTYRSDMIAARSAAEARPLPSAYLKDATAVAERRLTLAGYRLGDVASALMRPR